MIDRSRIDLSVRRQCVLLRLARSGIYRQPAVPDPEELALMRWLDEQYLATPFYGSRRMTAELRKAGRQVNRKRVQRLMRLIGRHCQVYDLRTTKSCILARDRRGLQRPVPTRFPAMVV